MLLRKLFTREGCHKNMQSKAQKQYHVTITGFNACIHYLPAHTSSLKHKPRLKTVATTALSPVSTPVLQNLLEIASSY